MNEEYKFNYKFKVETNRLKDFDYSENAGYFITICTKDRINYFWDIIDWKVILNEFWKIVFDDLNKLENHYNYVKIDEFIVMPNHIHFIVFINGNNKCRDVSLIHLNKNKQNSHFNKNKQNYFSNIAPKKWNLWNIIKLFKWYSKKKINKISQEYFGWQANYYDRIIRNEIELNKIRKYIKDNPLKWEFEKDNNIWISM